MDTIGVERQVTIRPGSSARGALTGWRWAEITRRLIIR